MRRFFMMLIVAVFLVGPSEMPGNETPAKTDSSSPSDEYAWKQLFDGKTLDGWSVPKYGGDGEVKVADGCIVIGQGAMMTGIKYEKVFPKLDYEIRFEAKRTSGNDFFAALTFPYGEHFCTFINGGWGGATTGLSSVDGCDASENETGDVFGYLDDKWYRFRLRVTGRSIQAWISETDKEGKPKETFIVDLETKDKTISIRDEVDDFKPLGFCTWVTEGRIRNIEFRKLKPKEVEGTPTRPTRKS